MSRKSLLVSMSITTVGRAHRCRYNKLHQLAKGDKRLTVKVDGEPHNYCLVCAKVFLADSAKRLDLLRSELESLTGTVP
jgi:hypothetical protein